MTTGVSYPSSYVDFSRRPSEFARAKFSDQFWNEALGYISAIAFAALALIVNIVLLSLATPYEFVVINTCLFTTAYALVAPFVASCFAAARKLQAQGEKEMRINARMTVIQTANHQAISNLLVERDIQVNTTYFTTSVEHLLARVSYYEDRAEDLRHSAQQLENQGKFIEASESTHSSHKAKAKAAFFASLIGNPGYRFSKFKDAFVWTDISLRDRLARRALQHPSADILLERRGDVSKVLRISDLNQRVGTLGRQLTALLSS